MNCSDCKHFRKQLDPNNVTRSIGICVVLPPQFVLMPQPGGMAPAWAFPTVEGASYCGQFNAEPLPGEFQAIQLPN